jgi:hypothetical protein
MPPNKKYLEAFYFWQASSINASDVIILSFRFDSSV